MNTKEAAERRLAQIRHKRELKYWHQWYSKRYQQKYMRAVQRRANRDWYNAILF